MRSEGVPRGFALLEVLVALAIGGLVVLAARLVYSQLADSAERVVEAARAADTDANAERLLRAWFIRVEPGTSGRSNFVGHETGVRFDTWCDVPAGWQERCTVTLAVLTDASAEAGREPPPDDEERRGAGGASGGVLVAGRDGGATQVLRRGFQIGALRYLYDTADGGTWLRSWSEVVSIPLAVGLVLDGDTLVLRIGERG